MSTADVVFRLEGLVVKIAVLKKILSSSISISGEALRMESLSCATHQECPGATAAETQAAFLLVVD